MSCDFSITASTLYCLYTQVHGVFLGLAWSSGMFSLPENDEDLLHSDGWAHRTEQRGRVAGKLHLQQSQRIAIDVAALMCASILCRLVQ